jgi:small subunit ribosomal protein S2
VTQSLVKELVEAGVHFGHRSSLWNPKMAPYIYARKNQIHIIDVRETLRGILRAQKYLEQVAAGGSLVLFVGTKRQAAGTIERESQRCGMPFVAERWLGGALTNFRTVRSRLGRLVELEELRAGERINEYSKKMQSALNREFRKMYRNLNGLRTLNRLPECVVVVDPRKEKNAIRESRRLGITTVALIDTDCDPDVVDLPIPCNDDGIRSIEIVIRQLTEAVIRGNAKAAAQAKQEASAERPEEPTSGSPEEPTDATPETVPNAEGVDGNGS